MKCIQYALAALDERCPSEAELERYIGPPLHRAFEAILGADPARIARAVALYRERFSTVGIFENSIYPGIPSVLERLKGLGARLILATSKPTLFAERVVRHFGLDRHMDAIHGSELDGTRSNKAQLIAHVLEMESIAPAGSCMVGDREHDVRGAVANGVFPIGALWGYGSRRELVDAGAAALCEEPGDVLDLLCERDAK